MAKKIVIYTSPWCRNRRTSRLKASAVSAKRR
jgi:hypothetical protein